MENLFLYGLVVVYLFVIGTLGYQGFRGTKTAADYLIGGRQIHPFVMAMSYGATFISTSAIIGFGGAAAMFGMGLLWLTFLNIFVGVFIAFVFIGARTRAMGHRLDAHTFPELLGRRFQSRTLQAVTAGTIVLVMPLYTGVVLIGAARFIGVRLGISDDVALFFFSALIALYVVMGGLKGVMYTDAVQGAIMLVGMLLLVVLTYSRLGGVLPAHEALTALPDVVRASEAEASIGLLANLSKAGHEGWTSMARFGTPFWWITVSTIILGVGIGVLAQPQLCVRFMTVKSRRELNRGVLIGAIFILVATGVAYVVGSLSNVLFFEDPRYGQIARVAAGDVDSIIPEFITGFMPLWLGDVFFVTLMAAAMSTVSSQFHAMGTAVSRDLYENLSGRTHERSRGLLVSRVGILITFLFSVFLAYILPELFKGTGSAIIARGTALFFGLCASAFLPVFLAGLYWRGVTKAGALAGCVTGLAVSAFWLLFVHLKEAEIFGLSQALLGRPSLLHKMSWGWFIWDVVDPVVVALPLATLAMIGVSLATRRYPAGHLAGCFGDGE